MSLVIVETLSDFPLTPEDLTDTDRRVLDCLTEREARWRYSLLSSDRHRMICTFEAPDAESVRESYRKGGGFFSRIWAGELIQSEQRPSVTTATTTATLKIIEGTHQGLTEADRETAHRQILPCYAERKVEWIKSYISLDQTRSICELNALDAEAVRAAHRHSGIPFDRVWSAIVIQP